MVKKIEKVLIDNNWTIVEDLIDEPLVGKKEEYDVTGMTFNEEFQIICSYYEHEDVIVHKVFKSDATLFGNLRIYSKEPLVIFNEVIKSSKNLSKNNYAQFVKEIHSICEKLIFNDNGVWVKVNFSN